MTDRDTLLPIGYVAVPVEEYVDLIATNDRYDSLRYALYDNATLSWDKNNLRFDDEKVSSVLSAIDNRYFGTLNRMKKEAEELEKGTDND